MLLPTPRLRRRIESLAAEVGAGFILLDPAVPLGLVGPHLSLPYAVLVHGAEITVPARLPGGRASLARVLNRARLVISNSDYPALEACRIALRQLPTVTVYPGVDGNRFRPFDDAERVEARERFGLPVEGLLVLGLSRLVRRKGFDVLIEASARLAAVHPELVVAIGGDGRERAHLQRLASRVSAPVRFLGRVADDDLPALFGAADVFAMLCRNRWRGVEQEGFGIVFVEAAAAGVPAIAGASGGAAEAVVDGVTGVVVGHPERVDDVTAALAGLLADANHRRHLGTAARARALVEFDHAAMADRLGTALATLA
jgi:phosphatidylinositol alpha-1,6-mannosyltransferase